MNAYTGNEPFAFISYSHADQADVERIIAEFKRAMCRIWYDEGLTPGESWNDDLAEHIKRAQCLIVVLSRNSVASQYVKSELNYAISKGKKIFPIMLEEFELPAGIEMMLGSYQHTKLFGKNDRIEELISALPPQIFASKKEPFFENEEYALFLKTECIEKPITELYNCIINCKSFETGEVRELFRFEAPGSYDVDYTVTQCKNVRDDYFIGKTHSINIFNVLARCSLCYPLCGPDVDLLLIFSLRTPRGEFPSVKLIDYQYTNVVHSLSTEGLEVKDSPWGQFLDQKCRELLCK